MHKTCWRAAALVVMLFVSWTSSGCTGLLVDLGLGAERGHADLRWHKDDDGIAYLERDVRAPTATVLMVHGFGGDKDHWTRFGAYLPQDLRLIAIDLPGFGESPKDPRASYASAAQVARLKRFVDAHGLRGFHLVGNSMGGRIATEYALAYPDDVATLVLFDPAGVTPPPGTPTSHVVLVNSAADFDALLVAAFVKPPVVPGFLKEYFGERARADAPLAHQILDELSATPGRLEERLDRLQPPALVVWGASDRIIDPASAPIWRARLREGDVVLMDRVGHAPMLERPEESATLVAVWWRRRGAL
jgi:pimeloyl-ACP methyl ester carboxylesterase